MLTHKDWAEGIKAIADLPAEDRIEAVSQLRELLAKADAAHSASISRWHIHQGLALLAQLECAGGAGLRAAELYERAAREAHADYRSAKLSAAWSFAEAALLRFEVGESGKGLELATEALSLAEPHLDPSATYERLVAEVRRAREAEARGA